MRDINRIPEIVKELEKVWMENPDFRLGQLITVLTKPSDPHPGTFYIEDDTMLNRLKRYGEKNEEVNSRVIPYWKKYPDFIRMKTEDISVEIIQDMMEVIKAEKTNITITPIKLMQLIGAPILDEKWMSGHTSRLEKLRTILQELKDKDILEEIEIGYGIKGC